jgi:ABC-type multidrug transport system ATPase subunit
MIRIQELTKEYSGPLGGLAGGRVRALDGLTLEVAPGTAMGVVGPNGAGKSTLIRLLLGYLRPTAGAVSIGGLAPRAFAERHGIGYVPERPAIPPRWTTAGALRAFAALGEVEPWEERVTGAMRDLGLAEEAHRRVGALSKGNLQRLALAQALLGARKLLILDEPTDGVDPEWRARIRELLARWRRADPERVLFFASHDLDEVERVSDRVVVLAEGRLREVLDLSSTAAGLPPYRLELDGDSAGAHARVVELFPGAVPLGGLTESSAAGVWHVRAADLAALNRGVARLLESGLMLRALVPELPTLEERFRDTMRRPEARAEVLEETRGEAGGSAPPELGGSGGGG